MSATTRTAAELFTEWKLDHEAAMNPCMDCLFAKCPEDEHPTLHALFDVFFDTDSPRPPWSPVQLRRIDEHMRPLIDRAMADPAVMASQDQIEAAWRDKPWWRKAHSRTRFRWTCWRMRASGVGRKKPWE